MLFAAALCLPCKRTHALDQVLLTQDGSNCSFGLVVLLRMQMLHAYAGEAAVQGVSVVWLVQSRVSCQDCQVFFCRLWAAGIWKNFGMQSASCGAIPRGCPMWLIMKPQGGLRLVFCCHLALNVDDCIKGSHCMSCPVGVGIVLLLSDIVSIVKM